MPGKIVYFYAFLIRSIQYTLHIGYSNCLFYWAPNIYPFIFRQTYKSFECLALLLLPKQPRPERHRALRKSFFFFFVRIQQNIRKMCEKVTHLWNNSLGILFELAVSYIFLTKHQKLDAFVCSRKTFWMRNGWLSNMLPFFGLLFLSIICGLSQNWCIHTNKTTHHVCGKCRIPF